MSNHDLLPADVLRRKAVVYVRQSTQTQVQVNLESKRRQYGWRQLPWPACCGALTLPGAQLRS